MDRIAVLIPCYNEAKTIEKVVREYKAALPDDAVIYVYDNNSSDGTADIAKAAGAVVRRETMQGKGNVIRRMFREIDAQCYIMTDGDDTYPAEDAAEMAKLVLEEQADMVVGDRLSSTYFEENKRPFHNFGNSFVRGSINLLFGAQIRDIMTGYRAFSYEFVKTFPVLSRGFEIETEMSIHAIDRNMNVVNHIIEYRDRPEGSESKLNTYSDGMKVINTILRLFRICRPMKFFGSIAAILIVAAAILMIPVFVEYFATGLVPRFPTLFVACSMTIIAVQSFFAGLILSAIEQRDRQEFELRLNDVSREKR
ncbi:MAG: glycosyltransferase family 2 protein [Lachnospiraceae bacterium]|nr:glycosyltransferase family 2 protein [Lachnospiraceae bacterium]